MTHSEESDPQLERLREVFNRKTGRTEMDGTRSGARLIPILVAVLVVELIAVSVGAAYLYLH